MKYSINPGIARITVIKESLYMWKKKKFGDSNSFVDPGKDQKMARMLLSHSAGQTFSGQGRNHFENTLGSFRLTQSYKNKNT